MNDDGPVNPIGVLCLFMATVAVGAFLALVLQFVFAVL